MSAKLRREVKPSVSFPRMPAVEEDISRIMKKNLPLAAFLPNSKELIGVVILCPKEVASEKILYFTSQEGK